MEESTKLLPREKYLAKVRAALDALETDHDFLTAGGVFPEKLIEIWIRDRRKDLERHAQMPTPMEYEMYYDL